MNTYTLTEIELKNALLFAFIHGIDVEAGESNKSFEVWEEEKLKQLSGAKKEDIPALKYSVLNTDGMTKGQVITALDNEISTWKSLLESNKKEDIQPVLRWVKADTKPEYNVGVLVFIPDEDFHITSGMWDVSNKWVLLDEYRVPDCEITHWMPIPEIPEEYKKEQQDNNEIMGFLSKHKHIFKEELSPSKSSQKQSLIELMEADQRDGIYGVRDNGIRPEKALSDLWKQKQSEWIDSHIIPMYATLRAQSIKYFLKDGTVSGSFRQALEDIMNDVRKFLLNPDPQNTTKEPVIDWEGLEDAFYTTTKLGAPASYYVNWLKSNLSNYIQVNQH